MPLTTGRPLKLSVAMEVTQVMDTGHIYFANLWPKRIILLKQSVGIFVRRFVGEAISSEDLKLAGILSAKSIPEDYVRKRSQTQGPGRR